MANSSIQVLTPQTFDVKSKSETQHVFAAYIASILERVPHAQVKDAGPRRSLLVACRLMLKVSSLQVLFLLLVILYQFRAEIIPPFPHEANSLSCIVRRQCEVPLSFVNGHEPHDSINTLGELAQKLHARFFRLIESILIDEVNHGIGEAVKVGLIHHEAVAKRITGRWGRNR